MSIRKIWRKFFLITRRGNIAWHQGHRLFEVFLPETAILLLLLGIHDEAESLLRATLNKYTNYHHNPGETCFQIMLPCLVLPDLFLFTKIWKCYSFNVQLRVLRTILSMLIYVHQGVCLTPSNTIFNPCDQENKLRCEVMIMSDLFIYIKLTRRVGSVCVYCNKNP